MSISVKALIVSLFICRHPPADGFFNQNNTEQEICLSKNMKEESGIWEEGER